MPMHVIRTGPSANDAIWHLFRNEYDAFVEKKEREPSFEEMVKMLTYAARGGRNMIEPLATVASADALTAIAENAEFLSLIYNELQGVNSALNRIAAALENHHG